MNAMQVYNFEDNDIRVIDIDGAPWFVGSEVAKLLGYERPNDALHAHIDDEDKNTTLIHSSIRGNPNRTIINESGLYSFNCLVIDDVGDYNI